MAHNLATIGGRVAMAYQGETPWHKLGTRIDHGIDIAAVLQAASLDWTIRLEPLFLQDGRRVERQAVVRDGDNDVIETVSKWYQPIQNAEAFGVFQPALEQYGLTVEAAGALGKGERVWMLFKLPTSSAPVAGDDIRGYGVAVTGHNGTQAFEFRPTPIRVVCQNTLNAAVGTGLSRTSRGQVFSIQHIGNVKDQVAQVGKLVENVLDAMKATGDTFAALAHRKMTPAEVVTYIESVFPSDKDDISKSLAEKRATVADLVWSGMGADLAMSETDGQPNPWAYYNAVAEYFDHVRTAKAHTPPAQRIANRSAIFGNGSDIKWAALKRAQQLVAA